MEVYNRQASDEESRGYATFERIGSRQLSIQSKSIIFIGRISDPESPWGRLGSACCGWHALAILSWIGSAIALGTVWYRYRANWGMDGGSHDHHATIDCEPLPLWMLVSCVLMVVLSGLTASVMLCEYAIYDEIYSIWIIGGGHCLLCMSLTASIVWVGIIGWAWVLDSSISCGPAVYLFAVWFLPVITVFLSVALIMRMYYTLDTSEGKSLSVLSCLERLKRVVRMCTVDCTDDDDAGAPLYGRTISDMDLKTTRDLDLRSIGEDTLLAQNVDEKQFIEIQALTKVIRRRWFMCIERQDKSRVCPGSTDTIGYEDFVEYFASFFDEIGNCMGQRLYNSLSDFNGRLTLRRLRNGVFRWSQGSMRDRLTFIFDIWDSNRNGFLDKEEVHDMMTTLAQSAGTSFLSRALALGESQIDDEGLSNAVDELLERFETLDFNGSLSLENWLKFAEGDSSIREFLERFTVRTY